MPHVDIGPTTRSIIPMTFTKARQSRVHHNLNKYSIKPTSIAQTVKACFWLDPNLGQMKRSRIRPPGLTEQHSRSVSARTRQVFVWKHGYYKVKRKSRKPIPSTEEATNCNGCIGVELRKPLCNQMACFVLQFHIKVLRAACSVCPQSLHKARASQLH